MVLEKLCHVNQWPNQSSYTINHLIAKRDEYPCYAKQWPTPTSPDKTPGGLHQESIHFIRSLSGVHQEFMRSIRTPDGVHLDWWGSVSYSTFPPLLRSPGPLQCARLQAGELDQGKWGPHSMPRVGATSSKNHCNWHSPWIQMDSIRSPDTPDKLLMDSWQHRCWNKISSYTFQVIDGHVQI